MEILIKIPQGTQCRIVKWKVKVGSRISKSTILALYQTDTSEKQDKLKSNCVGIVKKLLVKEGERVHSGGNVLSYEGCQHPIVMKDMCAECGADLREKDGLPGDRKSGTSASVAMVHSVPELIVSEEQAKSLGQADEQRLLKSRKLVLLVDLDQTLIHTTNDNVPANLKDVYHFQLWHGRQLLWYHTRFRPGTEDFLRAVSQMYELHICTFGARLYAHTIARLLDPAGEFFSHRILSRDECFNVTSKTANLKALFPCGDSMVCIIDDREDVWNFIPSLVHVKPYSFFEGTADINAPPGLQKGGKDSGKNGKKERKSRIVRVPKKAKVTEEEKGGEKKSETNTGSAAYKDDKASLESKHAEEKEPAKSEQYKGEEANRVVAESNDKTAGSEPAVTSGNEEGKWDTSNSLEVSMDVSDASEKNVKDSEGTFDDDFKLSDDDDEEDGEESTKDSELKESHSKPNSNDKDSNTDTTKEEELKDSTDEKVSTDSVSDTKDKPSVKSKDNAEGTFNDESEAKDEDDDDEYEEMVVWEDDDDYLIYLQDILTRIHTAFFQMYDEAKDKQDKEPDLKKIIPYIRTKILRGANILFSGIFPTNVAMEKTRAFVVAKSLGANVHTVFISKEQAEEEDAHTTHVIALRPGTSKVNQAAKHKGVLIVKADWLWSCNDRWERVDERLFLLPVDFSKINEKGTASPKPNDKKMKGDEKEPAASTSGAQIEGRRFSESINPMYKFSVEDIADMDKEVDDEISGSNDDEEKDNEDEDSEDCADNALRSKVLGHTPPESSSDDSLDIGTPRGWKNKKKRKRQASVHEESRDAAADDWDVDDPDEAKVKLCIEARESPHRVFHRGSDSSTSTDGDDDYNESVGSIDDEMVEAIEKEFLNQ